MLADHFRGKQGKVWGTTERIFYSETCRVEYAEIRQGFRSSNHKHIHGHNLFYIVSGELRIVSKKGGLDDAVVLTAGLSLTVDPGTVHRFESLTDVKLIEVYWVEMIGEDIEREDQGGPLEPAETP